MGQMSYCDFGSTTVAVLEMVGVEGTGSVVAGGTAGGAFEGRATVVVVVVDGGTVLGTVDDGRVTVVVVVGGTVMVVGSVDDGRVTVVVVVGGTVAVVIVVGGTVVVVVVVGAYPTWNLFDWMSVHIVS